MVWITSQKDIHVRSIDETTKVIDDLSAYRYINYNSYLRAKTASLAPFLYPVVTGVYLDSNTAFNMKIKGGVFTVSFYIVIFLISIAIAFSGGFIISSRLSLVALICMYGVPAITILFLIYTLYDLELGYRGAIVMVLSLGACIGIWSSFLRLKKRSFELTKKLF